MIAVNWKRVLFEGIDVVHDEADNGLDANPAACRRREDLLMLNTRDIHAPEFAAGFGNHLQFQVGSKPG